MPGGQQLDHAPSLPVQLRDRLDDHRDLEVDALASDERAHLLRGVARDIRGPDSFAGQCRRDLRDFWGLALITRDDLPIRVRAAFMPNRENGVIRRSSLGAGCWRFKSSHPDPLNTLDWCSWAPTKKARWYGCWYRLHG
jgi:hypothetical protein